jgi:uncharacterized protein (TIGR02246 family)
MRTLATVTLLLISAPLVASPPLRGGMVGTLATDPDPAITKRADAYVAAMLAGDATAVVSLYRDDAVEMPPCQPSVRGRAAIEQYYRKLFEGAPARITGFTLTHAETRVAGDVAYDVGTSRQTVSTPSGAVEETGKFLVLLKRTDGEWKVAYAIYSGDRLAPPAATPGR